PNASSERGRLDWDETVFGLDISLAGGWQQHSADDRATLTPSVSGFVVSNPVSHAFVEASSELDWPIGFAEEAENRYVAGQHHFDGLLTFGETHGFDWLLSYDASHGDNAHRDIRRGGVGPAPFFMQHVTTSLRPRVHFDQDFEFGLSGDYGYREWVYGG